MDIPFVYADFNSIERYTFGGYDSRVGMTGYGSIASLSTQRIKLREGMDLIVYEPLDIEATGVAHFDLNCSDPAGRIGMWFVLVNNKDIRDSKYSSEAGGTHLCFGCRYDLKEHLDKSGRRYQEKCPRCGTEIMTPLSPP